MCPAGHGWAGLIVARASAAIRLIALVGLVAVGVPGAAAQDAAGTPGTAAAVHESGDWPMYRGDPARTGATRNSGPASAPVERWRVRLGVPFAGRRGRCRLRRQRR